jgi:hypothetical protein
MLLVYDVSTAYMTQKSEPVVAGPTCKRLSGSGLRIHIDADIMVVIADVSKLAES